jgi:hypothetical protein
VDVVSGIHPSGNIIHSPVAQEGAGEPWSDRASLGLEGSMLGLLSGSPRDLQRLF